MKSNRVAVVLLCVTNILSLTLYIYSTDSITLSNREQDEVVIRECKCSETLQKSSSETIQKSGSKTETDKVYATKQSLKSIEVKKKKTIFKEAIIHEGQPRARIQPGSTVYTLDKFPDNDNIPLQDIMVYEKRAEVAKDKENLCPQRPPELYGGISVVDDAVSPSWNIMSLQNSLVKEGRYSPQKCTARYRIAIIIPMNAEFELLKALLHHIHPVLRRQQLDYTLYTMTMKNNEVFNRAKLFNAGFVEANKDGPYDCYVFHDVNLLVEDDGCLYWCADQPRQISFYINKFNYAALKYPLNCREEGSPKLITYSGGVISLPHNIFLEINGFSNLYWGWGGDDDDLFYRLWKKGYTVMNPYETKCSFTMVDYRNKDSYKKNEKRFELLYHAASRMKDEGLSTLRYKTIKVERKQLYVNITVDLGEPTDKMMDFMSSPAAKCGQAKMPWL